MGVLLQGVGDLPFLAVARHDLHAVVVGDIVGNAIVPIIVIITIRIVVEATGQGGVDLQILGAEGGVGAQEAFHVVAEFRGVDKEGSGLHGKVHEGIQRNGGGSVGLGIVAVGDKHRVVKIALLLEEGHGRGQLVALLGEEEAGLAGVIVVVGHTYDPIVGHPEQLQIPLGKAVLTHEGLNGDGHLHDDLVECFGVSTLVQLQRLGGVAKGKAVVFPVVVVTDHDAGGLVQHVVVMEVVLGSHLGGQVGQLLIGDDPAVPSGNDGATGNVGEHGLIPEQLAGFVGEAGDHRHGEEGDGHEDAEEHRKLGGGGKAHPTQVQSAPQVVSQLAGGGSRRRMKGA